MHAIVLSIVSSPAPSSPRTLQVGEPADRLDVHGRHPGERGPGLAILLHQGRGHCVLPEARLGVHGRHAQREEDHPPQAIQQLRWVQQLWDKGRPPCGPDLAWAHATLHGRMRAWAKSHGFVPSPSALGPAPCCPAGDNFSTKMRNGVPNLSHMASHATYEP
jgi:hypothetical protein